MECLEPQTCTLDLLLFGWIETKALPGEFYGGGTGKLPKACSCLAALSYT